MKKTKGIIGLCVVAATAVFLIAADHIDAPAIAGDTADIADFFAYEPTEDSDRTVFQVDVQSNVLPELAFGAFDENVLTEINIDTDGDLVEDLVIQAIPRDGTMYFFGPGTPQETGINSSVLVDMPLGNVAISSSSPIVSTDGEVSLFAGPRQDPFFFDFTQFGQVIGGNAPEGFLAAGEATNTFENSNTMAIVIEIPNSMLGTPTATNVFGIPVYKTWVTTNKKQ